MAMHRALPGRRGGGNIGRRAQAREARTQDRQQEGRRPLVVGAGVQDGRVAQGRGRRSQGRRGGSRQRGDLRAQILSITLFHSLACMRSWKGAREEGSKQCPSEKCSITYI